MEVNLQENYSNGGLPKKYHDSKPNANLKRIAAVDLIEVKMGGGGTEKLF